MWAILRHFDANLKLSSRAVPFGVHQLHDLGIFVQDHPPLHLQGGAELAADLEED